MSESRWNVPCGMEIYAFTLTCAAFWVSVNNGWQQQQQAQPTAPQPVATQSQGFSPNTTPQAAPPPVWPSYSR